MKMKKLAVLMALACFMFASPALAIDEMYQSEYYNDGAIQMQYVQTQLPLQTYIQGADMVVTDLFAASADLVIVQALPQEQMMGGRANGGQMSVNTSSYDYRQLNINAAIAIGDDYVNADAYPYNYNYNYYNGAHASANDYCDNRDNENPNVAIAASIWYYDSHNDYYNMNTSLPASGQMGATQTAANQTVLETPNMKLAMTQIASQGGYLKMKGHGSQGNNYCD